MHQVAKRWGAALWLLAAAGIMGCETTETTRPLPGAVDSLVVVPDSAAVSVGGVTPFTVVAFDSLGRPVSVTVTWSSSDEAVVTVDNQGRAFGVAEGRAWVRATVGAVADSASVTVAAAVRGWFPQSSGSTGTHLNGVHFTGVGLDGWIVGDNGRILRTYDAGTTWAPQTAATTARLHSVWFTSVNEGWIVGNAGTVLRTTNGGLNWSRMTNTFAAENLHDVVFTTRDSGWIVGANGVVLRTTNGGTSWQRLTTTAFDLNAVAFRGSRDGWAVGTNGVIVGTHDGGASWFVVQPGVTDSDLRGVWKVSATRANAVGIGGATPRTIVGPDSVRWEGVEVGAPYLLESVIFATETVGWAVGFGNGAGLVLRSEDGGASWVQQPATAASALNDVFFVNAQSGWAVGDNGIILRTVTGGLP